MRLIDADALMRDIEKYHLSDGKFQHWVEVQPTIEERKTGDIISREVRLIRAEKARDTIEQLPSAQPDRR